MDLPANSPIKKNFIKNASNHQSKGLMVTLHYSGKCYTFPVEYADRCCEDLYNVCLEKVQEIESSSSYRSMGDCGTGSTDGASPAQDPSLIC